MKTPAEAVPPENSTLSAARRPLVSAIVSTYNCERFMRGCLESLTEQTLFTRGDLEIVIVDSGSPTNERAIVEEFQQKFSNIIYERSETRETIFVAWNRCIALSHGRYITYACTDDRHRPDCLEILAKHLEAHDDVALVYADQLVSYVPNESFAGSKAQFRWDWPNYSLAELHRRCIVGPQPLWRRSLHDKYGGFQEDLRSAGDYEFWLRLTQGGEKLQHLPEILGVYYFNLFGMEHSGGFSIKETEEIRQRYGIVPDEIGSPCTVPIPISPEDLNALPYRNQIPVAARASFDPLKPDYDNTPVSAGRRQGTYRLYDPHSSPAVTILTPFYNTGDVFHETARSVFNQTFQQWEWLIVNDCSTNPEALRVLDQYRRLDPRIKVIDQPANAGPSAARNAGVKAARADYIAMVDSDDLLEPTAVEKWFWYLISHPEHTFVKGFTVGFGASGYCWRNGFHNREAFLRENQLNPTSMIRKSAFAVTGGQLEDMRQGFEDWEFWLRCAKHGLWGGTIPEFLDWYRRRENHNDRWSNWDSGSAQRKFLQELQNKYRGLEKTFPNPTPPPVSFGTRLNLDFPAHNHLQKPKPRCLFLMPWMTLGGADKFNLDLVQQMVDSGWEITCATTLKGDHAWMPEFAKFTSDIFALPHFLDEGDYPRFLCYLIKSRQIDTVLISHSMLGYQYLPFLRAQFPGVAFVDYCHMEQEDWLNGGYPNYAAQNAPVLDLTVVSSLHLQKWVASRSAYPEQVEVCYTNIDAGAWTRQPAVRAGVRKQLELSDDHPVILYAGRIVEQKQPHVFAETMRLLRRKNANFTALVAGDGKDLAWLKESVTKNGLSENVVFLGAVPNPRVRELMQAADIFFLPSQWEGIALSIFEAMASGLAVVGADVGGQRELVVPGSGYLLPRAQPEVEAQAYAAVLAELTANVEQARAIGATARARVTQEFPLHAMGRRMLALLEKAKKNHATGIKPVVSREVGNAIVSQFIDLARVPRCVETGLELARQQKWLPAMGVFQHVLALARQTNNAPLAQDMSNALAHLEKFAKAASVRPVVSVVIPCYNYARLLPEAVQSVLQQTFQNFEIIIVNDGSKDNTIEVANQLIQQNSGRHRIRLVDQPNSGHPGAARNAGIKIAIGEFILPLDADDKIAPTFLEKTVAVLRSSPQIGVAYANIQHFGDVNTIYNCGPFDSAVLARDNVLPYCSLYRRSLWEQAGGYRLMGYEDWDFWLTLVERGCRGQLIPEPLFLYRKHGQGMLNQDNRKRQRLLAQMVVNHPSLYDGPSQNAAREILAQQAVASAPKTETAPVVPGRKPLRVTYLITSILGVTGGNQTLLRQADEMRRRGHQVSIVTYTPKPDWFKFEMPVVQAPTDRPLAEFVPPSDIVVATYFTNAGELKAVKAPVKIYYAQGDQFIFDDATMADTPENRAWRKLSRASYELPGIRFVPNSRNLATAVQNLCGRKPDAILPVCTDQTIFHPLHKSIPGSKFRILIVGPDARGTAAEPLLFKGIQDIHDGLQLLARKYPYFTAVRMSGTAPDIFAKFPCEFYIAPNDETKTALFGTSHILIYASHYDSCPRPPQEAMAAGCAVVCTATTGAMEYCRDDENALLVPIQAPDAIAAAVEKLIHNHALREKLVAGGLATAAAYPREREWNEWENILYRFMEDAAQPVVSKPVKQVTAIKLPPAALAGHLGEARALLEKKNWRGAHEIASAALKVRPFHPEAWLLLGKVAQGVGDAATARQWGQYAAKFVPDWKPAKQFIKGITPTNKNVDWLAHPENSEPRLTVCLIVKNEEKFIAQCLKSVREIAHQIIVVDTGSTDRTVEIARSFNAEIYTHPWNDDFSSARNEALLHATGDWVLSLDADEELSAARCDVLRKEMQNKRVLGYRLPIIDRGTEVEGCSYVPRLFRNAPGLFFVGRVHEQIFTSVEVRAREWGMEHNLGETTLLHHGYTKEMVVSRDKVARNLRLLKLAMEEMPDEPNLIMNLGLETIRAGQMEEGLDHYREALRIATALPARQVTPELRETLLTQLATHLLHVKKFAEIVELSRQPLAQAVPMTASQHFLLGLAFLELKQAASAAEQMRHCLAKRKQPALSPVNKEILTAAPAHCLALALAAAGQPAEAAKAFAEALTQDGQSRPIRFDFARFLFQQNRALDALKLTNVLIAENKADAVVWQLGGQIALSQPDFLPFALDWTGEALKSLPRDPHLLAQRAEALLLNQDSAGSKPFWNEGPLAQSPRHVAARILCELVAGEGEHAVDTSAEKAVSQEFLQWYRQLIRSKAHSVVGQINEKLTVLQLTLPSAATALNAALKQAAAPVAV